MDWTVNSGVERETWRIGRETVGRNRDDRRREIKSCDPLGCLRKVDIGIWQELLFIVKQDLQGVRNASYQQRTVANFVEMRTRMPAFVRPVTSSGRGR